MDVIIHLCDILSVQIEVYISILVNITVKAWAEFQIFLW